MTLALKVIEPHLTSPNKIRDSGGTFRLERTQSWSYFRLES